MDLPAKSPNASSATCQRRNHEFTLVAQQAESEHSYFVCTELVGDQHQVLDFEIRMSVLFEIFDIVIVDLHNCRQVKPPRTAARFAKEK